MNIAYSTVSRALNNSSGISEERRHMIIQMAKEMGYEPNLNARQLRNGGSNTIGLIVPHINRVFFSNVIHGVETVTKSKGYNVIICQSNENHMEETECIKTLLTNNVAGILMSLSKETKKPRLHREIQKRRIPLVMFDRVFKEMETDKVLNDNFHGAYAVTKHMLDQGYRHIVHYAGPLTINIYRERAEGFRKALEDEGLPVSQGCIFEHIITKDSGYEQTNKLIESAAKFDAIFAASDFSALGAMLCLQEKNIEVPAKVGVAGYANEPFTELLHMTTLEQHSTELGKSAASLLFESIGEGNIRQMHKEVVIKPELIIRKSTLKTKE